MKLGKALATFAAVAAVAGTAHTLRNLTLLRRPNLSHDTAPTHTPLISVLIPARNEARRITPTLTSVLKQDYPNLEIIILDDASEDATAQIVMNLINGDKRARLISSREELPAGWLGKPYACHRLSAAASGELFIFLDADVVLTPDAISLAYDLFSSSSLDVMCPYPQQLMNTGLQRIVQPLLQWSWMTMLPLDLAETSSRGSLTAGNGQFLMISAAMYVQAGGHQAIRSKVIEDIELVRNVKAAGGRGGVVDGTDIAQCSMYETSEELIEGYSKSLWSAFGSINGARAISGLLFTVYVLPLVLLLSPHRPTRRRAAIALLSAAMGRALVNSRMKQHLGIEIFMHPLSIIAFNALTLRSIQLRQANQLTWKNRTLDNQVSS